MASHLTSSISLTDIQDVNYYHPLLASFSNTIDLSKIDDFPSLNAIKDVLEEIDDEYVMISSESLEDAIIYVHTEKIKKHFPNRNVKTLTNAYILRRFDLTYGFKDEKYLWALEFAENAGLHEELAVLFEMIEKEIREILDD